MNRLAETNVWNNPKSYAPNLEDQLAHYEKIARQARRGRFGFANRATRHSPSQSTLSRLFERVSAIACVALSLLTLAYFAWQFAGRPGL